MSMPLSFSLIGELAHFCIEYMYELHDFYWEVCVCVCVCVFSLSFCFENSLLHGEIRI